MRESSRPFSVNLTTITERAVRCRALNECLTTDETSNYLMIDELQAGPLGAARQRPSGGEAISGSELVRRAHA